VIEPPVDDRENCLKGSIGLAIKLVAWHLSTLATPNERIAAPR
jgi:hypothetical protein